jgi:hypothetical protein
MDTFSETLPSTKRTCGVLSRNAGTLPRREIVPRVRIFPKSRQHTLASHSVLARQAYEKSEKLDLDFWDPRRLASHVLATLHPGDQRTQAVDLILDKQITGAFLARYTYQIEE